MYISIVTNSLHEHIMFALLYQVVARCQQTCCNLRAFGCVYQGPLVLTISTKQLFRFFTPPAVGEAES